MPTYFDNFCQTTKTVCANVTKFNVNLGCSLVLTTFPLLLYVSNMYDLVLIDISLISVDAQKHTLDAVCVCLKHPWNNTKLRCQNPLMCDSLFSKIQTLAWLLVVIIWALVFIVLPKRTWQELISSLIDSEFIQA